MANIQGQITLEPQTSTPTAEKGKLYFDNSTSNLKVSTDGNTFVDVSGGVNFGKGWFAGFGGIDLDGIVTDNLPTNVIMCDTFSITAGNTLNVTKAQVIVANTVTIAATGILDADGQGAPGGAAVLSNQNPGGIGEYAGAGGGGGVGQTGGVGGAGLSIIGSSLAGGAAGAPSSNGSAASTTSLIQRGRLSVYDIPSSLLGNGNVFGGAGGGSGGGTGAGSAAGGDGGGIIIIFCQTLTLNGTIRANGTSGSNAGGNAGGGGGGAGGRIIIRAETITGTGTIESNGGDGGANGGGGAGNGAGGNGGSVTILTTAAHTLTATVTAGGGPGTPGNTGLLIDEIIS